MSNSNSNHHTLRVFDEIKRNANKKDPSKTNGFQVCAIVKGEGRLQEFEQYFDASTQPHFLPPGDYTVVPTGLYLDRDGRLQLGREFVPVAASKARAA